MMRLRFDRSCKCGVTYSLNHRFSVFALPAFSGIIGVVVVGEGNESLGFVAVGGVDMIMLMLMLMLMRMLDA